MVRVQKSNICMYVDVDIDVNIDDKSTRETEFFRHIDIIESEAIMASIQLGLKEIYTVVEYTFDDNRNVISAGISVFKYLSADKKKNFGDNSVVLVISVLKDNQKDCMDINVHTISIFGDKNYNIDWSNINISEEYWIEEKYCSSDFKYKIEEVESTNTSENVKFIFPVHSYIYKNAMNNFHLRFTDIFYSKRKKKDLITLSNNISGEDLDEFKLKVDKNLFKMMSCFKFINDCSSSKKFSMYFSIERNFSVIKMDNGEKFTGFVSLFTRYSKNDESNYGFNSEVNKFMDEGKILSKPENVYSCKSIKYYENCINLYKGMKIISSKVSGTNHSIEDILLMSAKETNTSIDIIQGMIRDIPKAKKLLRVTGS